MEYTLAHARTALAEFVDNGTCDTDRIDAAVNRSTRILLNSYWRSCVRKVRMQICHGCVTMPREIDMVLALTIDHDQANAWSKWYEFLDSGPLRIDSLTASPSKDLVEIGNPFPTVYDFDCEYGELPLVIMSTHTNDTNETVLVRGMSSTNIPIMGTTSPGELVPINRWLDGVDGQMPPLTQLNMSTNNFKSITSIVKPETEGFLTMYAYNADYTAGADGIPMLYLMGKYFPDETNPRYRRYKVVNHNTSTGDHIIALVKLAYVPAKYESDPLLIQNLDALQHMAQALAKYDAEDMGGGKQFEALAVTRLREQQSAGKEHTNTINVQYDEFSLGQISGVM